MSVLDFAAEVISRSIKILAVTGTIGKSTVVTFVGQVSYYYYYFCLQFTLLIFIVTLVC